MLEWTDQGQARLATARAKHDESLSHLANSRSHEAAASLETALHLRRSVLPPHHPVVIGTLELLATTTYRVGDLRPALEMFKDLHTQQIDRFGQHHPEVETTAIRIAEILTELGESKSSNAMYEQVWSQRTATQHDTLISDFEQLLRDLRLPEHISQQTADDHMQTMSAMQMHSYATTVGAANAQPGPSGDRRGGSDILTQVNAKVRDAEQAKQQSSKSMGGGGAALDLTAGMPTEMDPQVRKLLMGAQEPTAADFLLQNGVAPPRTDSLVVEDMIPPPPPESDRDTDSAPPPPTRPDTADSAMSGRVSNADMEIL